MRGPVGKKRLGRAYIIVVPRVDKPIIDLVWALRGIRQHVEDDELIAALRVCVRKAGDYAKIMYNQGQRRVDCRAISESSRS